jgi:hypothetical protein
VFRPEEKTPTIEVQQPAVVCYVVNPMFILFLLFLPLVSLALVTLASIVATFSFANWVRKPLYL